MDYSSAVKIIKRYEFEQTNENYIVSQPEQTIDYQTYYKAIKSVEWYNKGILNHMFWADDILENVKHNLWLMEYALNNGKIANKNVYDNDLKLMKHYEKQLKELHNASIDSCTIHIPKLHKYQNLEFKEEY